MDQSQAADGLKSQSGKLIWIKESSCQTTHKWSTEELPGTEIGAGQRDLWI